MLKYFFKLNSAKEVENSKIMCEERQSKKNKTVLMFEGTDLTSKNLDGTMTFDINEVRINCDTLTISQDLPSYFQRKIISIFAKKIRLQEKFSTFDLFNLNDSNMRSYWTITSGLESKKENGDITVYEIQKHESEESYLEYITSVEKKMLGENVELIPSQYCFYLRTEFFKHSSVYMLDYETLQWSIKSVDAMSYFLGVGTYEKLKVLTSGRLFISEIDHIPPKITYKEMKSISLPVPNNDIFEVLKKMNKKDMPCISLPYLFHRALDTTKFKKSRDKLKLHMNNGNFSSAVLENIILYQKGFETIKFLWDQTDKYLKKICANKTDDQSNTIKNHVNETKKIIKTPEVAIKFLKEALNAYISFISSKSFGGNFIALINDKESNKLRDIVSQLSLDKPHKLVKQDYVDLGNKNIADYYKFEE